MFCLTQLKKQFQIGQSVLFQGGGLIWRVKTACYLENCLWKDKALRTDPYTVPHKRCYRAKMLVLESTTMWDSLPVKSPFSLGFMCSSAWSSGCCVFGSNGQGELFPSPACKRGVMLVHFTGTLMHLPNSLSQLMLQKRNWVYFDQVHVSSIFVFCMLLATWKEEMLMKEPVLLHCIHGKSVLGAQNCEFLVAIGWRDISGCLEKWDDNIWSVHLVKMNQCCYC